MFKKNSMFTLLLSLIIIFYVSSCSQSEKKTDATLKLQLSKIINFSSGFGSGGAIISGKSNLGHSFLKVITTKELNIELANASWTITALMWDSNVGTAATGSMASPLNGDVVCGVSNANFSGGDVTINLILNNANCSQTIFSEGRFSMVNTKNRFAINYLEECNEVDSSIGYKCGYKNQGSALSYRVVVRGYNQQANGAVIPDNSSIASACNKVSSDKTDYLNIHEQGLPINYPSGSSTHKFPLEIAFFYDDEFCNEGPKGKYVLNLQQGLMTKTSEAHKILVSQNSCSFSSVDLYKSTPQESQIYCESLYGSWNGTSCSPASITEVIKSFVPASECTSSLFAARAPQTFALKHLIAIPKDFTCNRYINQSINIGSHPFASGDGSLVRPYKICTEWQLNQIGEIGAKPEYLISHFKLLNDLDMNKTFWGLYDKPKCSGATNSLINRHDNFNPLDQMYGAVCNSISGNSFSGTFDGSGKKISFLRTQAESVDHIGFVRRLSGGIQDVKFYKAEFSGNSYVGGIAGSILNNTYSFIKNVEFDGLDLRAKSGAYVGGAVGSNDSYFFNGLNIHIKNAKIEGESYVGGILGFNSGTLEKSSFRGTIKSHSYSGNFVGGLVGKNYPATGIIRNSFSEGYMKSGGQTTGGIVGFTYSSPEFTYSTMVIVNNYSSTNSPSPAYIGGIVGQGPLSQNSFFDGSVSYQGNVSYNGYQIPPFVHKLSQGRANSENVAFRNSNGTALGPSMDYNQLRSISSAEIHSDDRASWLFVSGSLPRLSWENRECSATDNQLSVSLQITTLKRGTLENPIYICKADQFYNMPTSTSHYYYMAEDINLSSMTNDKMLSSFNGNFNGEGNIFYGLSLTLQDDNDAAESVGLIKSNSGTIKNVKLFGNNLINLDPEDSSNGLFVGVNSGLISKIDMESNTLTSTKSVGLVAGTNVSQGSILDINVLDGKVSGKEIVGGVIGHNHGAISRVSFGGFISQLSGSSEFFNFGGITGLNNGHIDQALMRGTINIEVDTISDYLNVGGLIGGQAGTGSLTNSMVEDHTQITVKSIKNIGGLIGYNDGGSISKSFTLGKIIYSNNFSTASANEKIHPLVGFNNNGTLNNTYYLENSAASLKGNSLVSSCSNTSTNYSMTTQVSDFSGMDLFSLSSSMEQSGVYRFIPFTASASTINFLSSDYSNCPSVYTPITFYKSYASIGINGSASLSPTEFSNVNNFSLIENDQPVFNLAYSSKTNPSSSKRQTELYDFYRSEMYGTTPASIPPIWELEEGEAYPRLLQVGR